MEHLKIADIAGVSLTATAVVDRVTRKGAPGPHGKVGEAGNVLHAHDLQLRLDVVVRASERRILDLRKRSADEALDVRRCTQNTAAVRIGDIVHRQVAAGDEAQRQTTAECETKIAHCSSSTR